MSSLYLTLKELLYSEGYRLDPDIIQKIVNASRSVQAPFKPKTTKNIGNPTRLAKKARQWLCSLSSNGFLPPIDFTADGKLILFFPSGRTNNLDTGGYHLD